MELEGADKRASRTAPVRTLRKRKVLSEDEYLAQLSAILKRDFFPNLAKLEAQYEYLTAMERSDLTALRAAAARLNNPSTVQAPEMSVDDFQMRYVTEDTAGFEELLERVNATRRGRFAKVFKREAPLLLESSADIPTGKGRVCRENTRLEKQVDLSLLERDTNDVRHHYWRMRKEYGEKSAGSVSDVGSGRLRGYSFVETPDHQPERRYRVPDTPSRDALASGMARQSRARKEELLRTPAVQRLLKAHTPKIGSVFDVPKTPKRKK
ncbi:Aspartate aminotransferase [Paramicrosporidium saccamoebae]|uniref:Aspartate aminotransferase n=1 Tax=Paramicrosporidium saccamoebae TaxID=1246581 RepID=A0A2H9TI50_9FUNG|nr:Aspartate aminotransferase [Paramicrosporidium saccamoebae]